MLNLLNLEFQLSIFVEWSPVICMECMSAYLAVVYFSYVLGLNVSVISLWSHNIFYKKTYSNCQAGSKACDCAWWVETEKII